MPQENFKTKTNPKSASVPPHNPPYQPSEMSVTFDGEFIDIIELLESLKRAYEQELRSLNNLMIKFESLLQSINQNNHSYKSISAKLAEGKEKLQSTLATAQNNYDDICFELTYYSELKIKFIHQSQYEKRLPNLRKWNDFLTIYDYKQEYTELYASIEEEKTREELRQQLQNIFQEFEKNIQNQNKEKFILKDLYIKSAYDEVVELYHAIYRILSNQTLSEQVSAYVEILLKDLNLTIEKCQKKIIAKCQEADKVAQEYEEACKKFDDLQHELGKLTQLLSSLEKNIQVKFDLKKFKELETEIMRLNDYRFRGILYIDVLERRIFIEMIKNKYNHYLTLISNYNAQIQLLQLAKNLQLNPLSDNKNEPTTPPKDSQQPSKDSKDLLVEIKKINKKNSRYDMPLQLALNNLFSTIVNHPNLESLDFNFIESILDVISKVSHYSFYSPEAKTEYLNSINDLTLALTTPPKKTR